MKIVRATARPNFVYNQESEETQWNPNSKQSSRQESISI